MGGEEAHFCYCTKEMLGNFPQGRGVGVLLASKIKAQGCGKVSKVIKNRPDFSIALCR